MRQYLCVIIIAALFVLLRTNYAWCQNETSSKTVDENRDIEYESSGYSSDESDSECSTSQEGSDGGSNVEEETTRGQQLELKKFSERNDQDEEDNGEDSEMSDESDESSDLETTTSIVDEVVDKADSLFVFFDKLFQKADNKVSALNERISDMRTRLPGVTYGGSLMTIYYTMIPILRNTKDVMRKVLRVGNNALRWLGRKSSSGSGRPGRNYRYFRRNAGSRLYGKFPRYNRQRRRPNRFTARQRRSKS